MTEEELTTDIEYRHGITVLYDVRDNNPNGDPNSANNKPRIDKGTGKAVVTDVRLKRFLRDQLYDDGKGVYILNPQKTNVKETRDDMAERLLADDEGELPGEGRQLAAELCRRAQDVRYFGATFSFNNQLSDYNLPSLTGPLQFSHARSLNEVVMKDESKKMSTVINTDDDSKQGTLAEDNRLEYALIPFHGVVNENAAENTGLKREDVEELDSLIWRSIMNQTLTRSKIGHNPRLYVRVEYESDFHIGDLTRQLTIDKTESEPDRQMRDVSDVTVDITKFVDRINDFSDRVNQINLKVDKYLTLSYEDTVGGVEVMEKALNKDIDINYVSVYE